MLVTDLALRDMQRETASLFGWVPLIVRRLRRRPGSSQPAISPLQSHSDEAPCAGDAGTPFPVRLRFPDFASETTTMPAGDTESRFRWRRHPQLRNSPVAGTSQSNAASRRDPRSSAMQGVLLARGQRWEEARAAFAIAAADETTDLTAIPGFWNLSRRAMLVACLAYEDVERFRDAAALAAHVRTTYRPRAVTTTSPRRAVAGER